jgi:hypothetical protein
VIAEVAEVSTLAPAAPQFQTYVGV